MMSGAVTRSNGMGQSSRHILLDQWCEAVARGELAQVLALYEGDALLRPTLSPEVCSGLGAIERYFAGDEEVMGFLCRGIEQVRYQVAGELYLDHTLVLMGSYQFSGSETLHANFTFVLKESAEGFKILAHHSSLCLS